MIFLAQEYYCLIKHMIAMGNAPITITILSEKTPQTSSEPFDSFKISESLRKLMLKKTVNLAWFNLKIRRVLLSHIWGSNCLDDAYIWDKISFFYSNDQNTGAYPKIFGMIRFANLSRVNAESRI